MPSVWWDSQQVRRPPLGRFSRYPHRLGSHRHRPPSTTAGRRSGDQFNVYVADRLVLPTLTPGQIADIASGRIQLDALIRDFNRRELAFRFAVVTDGATASSVESDIRRGALEAGSPFLNPQ